MIENISNNNISSRITKLMEDSKTTGYRIIKECKLPSASFYKCLNNDSEWRVDHLLKISEYFNVTMDYLVKGESIDIEKTNAELLEKNKKLEQEKEQLYIEVTRLHKVAEAVREYNHIKQTTKGIEKRS